MKARRGLGRAARPACQSRPEACQKLEGEYRVSLRRTARSTHRNDPRTAQRAVMLTLAGWLDGSLHDGFVNKLHTRVARNTHLCPRRLNGSEGNCTACGLLRDAVLYLIMSSYKTENAILTDLRARRNEGSSGSCAATSRYGRLPRQARFAICEVHPPASFPSTTIPRCRMASGLLPWLLEPSTSQTVSLNAVQSP